MTKYVRTQSSDRLTTMDKLHVLVVEGSTQAGELIKNILNQLGFSNVFVAKNGFEGVRIIREVRIDIIFTDWELFVPANKNAQSEEEKSDKDIVPIDGALFVKRLRFSPSSPNPFVPVVMLLRAATDCDVSLARDAGVNEIVIKPFRADEFCDTITRVIDDPRIFITAPTYKGPCRRRSVGPIPEGTTERRKAVVRLVRRKEARQR